MLIRLLVLAAVALAVWALSRGLRRYVANARTPERFDASDGGAGRAEASAMLVTFSGPYCLVGSGGTVHAGWLGTPPEGAVEEALAAVAV